MAGVLGGKRSDHIKFVCQLGQLTHRSAKLHSGDGSGNHIPHRANARRRVGFGIKRFELARAALLKKKNDRLAGERIGLVTGQSLGAKQLG